MYRTSNETKGTAMTALHIDYVFEEDRQRAAATRQLASAEHSLYDLIARLDGLVAEIFPVAQEPGDDADQAYMALSDIIDGLNTLAIIAGRGARRYG